MHLRLRCVASHPKASANTPVEHVFSARHPRLVTGAGDMLQDHDTATNAIRAAIRTRSGIEKLAIVGSPPTVLAFLGNGKVASYVDAQDSLHLVEERSIAAPGRSVTLAHGAAFGKVAVFCKTDSPSVWCLPIGFDSRLGEPFKLRSDLEGDQTNTTFIDGALAKFRTKVATKQKARYSSVVAVATHPSRPFVAAAYENGLVRVWDADRREQRSHFDAQLLLRERITAIALHPVLSVVAVCTSHGRLLSFQIRVSSYKRGDQPALASSKSRDRRSQFCAVTFAHSDPAYLIALTSSRRLHIRIIAHGGPIMNSSRFRRPTGPLSSLEDSVFSSELPAEIGVADTNDASKAPFSLSCDAAFGLLAATFDTSGTVYVFQPVVDGLSGVTRPVSCGLDTPFSTARGNEFTGPVDLPAESLIVYGNTLFLYTLGAEQLSTVCRLPPGDIRYLEAARDGQGYCVGALVFYYGDDGVDHSEFSETLQAPRYVLCTRNSKGPWNVSEPNDGRAGCFLHRPGQHESVFILSNSGTMGAIFSFASKTSERGQPTRQNRGVQRFNLEGGPVSKVFQSPFASWTAVLYHDVNENRLAVSNNAFEAGSGTDNSAKKGVSEMTARYAPDTNTSLQLQEGEVVIDVRWQLLPSNKREHYIGAVMTDRRIHFVRDVLEPLSVFEFSSISRMVVPFTQPSFSWNGAGLIVLYGNAMFSVTLDGRHDLIAGLGHGDYVTCVVACLNDRLIYASPCRGASKMSVSVRSRPYGAVSSSTRGVISLMNTRRADPSQVATKLRTVLACTDVSQASYELLNHLMVNKYASVAYLVAASEQGKYVIPPLKRADFLSRMGDVRGALEVAETEYSMLQSGAAFHEGSELFRLFQRVMNLSFIMGDFVAARRCSALLGRRGTFSSFIDREGGYQALRAVLDYAYNAGDQNMVEKMRPLLVKSGNSSIASDPSGVPSRNELENYRRAAQGTQPGSLELGSTDKNEMFILVPVEQVDETKGPQTVVRTALPSIQVADLGDRLEMMRADAEVADPIDEEDEELEVGPTVYHDDGVASKAIGASADGQASVAVGDSSDDEEGALDDVFAVSNEMAPRDKALEFPVVKNETDVHPQGVDGVTAMTQVAAADTRERLMQLREASERGLIAQQRAGREIMAMQPYGGFAGSAGPLGKASSLRARALDQYSRRRFAAAQQSVDLALRALGRAAAQPAAAASGLLSELVHYKLACRLQAALDELGSTGHADSPGGRITAGRLAGALTGLELTGAHRVDALVRASEAQIRLGNFGTAGQALRRVKEIGVSEELRPRLRDLFALCQMRGFVDAAPQSSTALCYATLRALAPGVRWLGCSVCSGIFSAESGSQPGALCEFCNMGQIRLR